MTRGVPVRPDDIPVVFRGRCGTYTIRREWASSRQAIMQSYYPMLEIAFLRQLKDETLARYAAQYIADEISFAEILRHSYQGWYRTEEVTDA